jgi:rare lipoprotein A
MKRATTRGDYSKSFANQPQGLVSAEIDIDTGELASSISVKTRTEFFLAGNEPKTEATPESIETVRFRREEELPALLEARELGQPDSGKRPVTLKYGGQVGMANWYRPKSGEEMVASSPVLANGMKVKVTNVATGRSVVVTIAGRIPAESGYVISLAQPAASELDFVRSGSAEVRVEPAASR